LSKPKLTRSCRAKEEKEEEKYDSSSSLARQPLVGPGFLKKLCPFVSIEGDFLPILDP
jgi:hypothetical protein